jgi:hypothetical protein
MQKNDMIVTGSTFSNDAAEMNIEQTTFSGTWEFSDNSTIDFGVQISDVDNRAVSNFVQLNNWGGSTNPGDLADVVHRATIDGQFDELSGHDYDGEYGQIQTEFFTASLEDLIAVVKLLMLLAVMIMKQLVIVGLAIVLPLSIQAIMFRDSATFIPSRNP